MARPENLPSWNAPGVDVEEPSTTKKSTGHLPNERPPAQFFNWFWNLISSWLEYLQGYKGQNLIINGEMAIAERGTQTGQGASTAMTAVDRFRIRAAGSTVGRVTTSQESSGFLGFKNSLKIECTTAESGAAGTLLAVEQLIMAKNLQHLKYGNAAAKTIVLSFHLAFPKAGINSVAISQPDGTKAYIREFTVAAADVEEDFEVVFPGDAAGTIDNDSGTGLIVTFPLYAGTDFQSTKDSWLGTLDYATSNQQNALDTIGNVIQISGVHLEVGEVATEFPHKTEAKYLRDCQKYLVKFGADGTTFARLFSGQWFNSTNAIIVGNLPVEMRVPPTRIASVGNWAVNNSSGAAQAVTGYSSPFMSKKTVGFTVTASGATGTTAGHGTIFFANNDVTAYHLFESELS